MIQTKTRSANHLVTCRECMISIKNMLVWGTNAENNIYLNLGFIITNIMKYDGSSESNHRFHAVWEVVEIATLHLHLCGQ